MLNIQSYLLTIQNLHNKNKLDKCWVIKIDHEFKFFHKLINAQNYINEKLKEQSIANIFDA